MSLVLRPARLVALVLALVGSQVVIPQVLDTAQATGATDESLQGDSTLVITVDGVDMVVHQFTTVGDATFTPPLAITSIEYLVVGGGGGGGARYGGGGGGGGVEAGSLAVTAGQTLSITVGAGGTGGAQRASGVTQGPGSDGGASSLHSIIGSGGGGGGAGNSMANTPGRAGASGGGGGGVIQTSTVAPGGDATQGSVGGAGSYGFYNDANLAIRYIGLVAGGGGGSTGAGGNGNNATRTAGSGGAGASSSITGTALGYGGGGGGGAYTSSFFASDQIPGAGLDGGGDGTNTDVTPTKAARGGGGGGGGLSGEGRNGSGGGDGGDGVVIVRYPVSSTTTDVTASANSANVGDTVTFTGSVSPTDTTGTITFVAGSTTLGTCTLTRSSPGTCELDIDDLAAGDYAVVATYSGSAAYEGSSSASTVDVTIIKNSQTISVTTPAPASKVYNGTFDVVATSSSGLDVAITVTGGCSGSGAGSATITMTSGTTSCVVTYNQSGDASFAAASEVTNTITASAIATNVQYTGSTILSLPSSLRLSAQTSGSALCASTTYSLDRSPLAANATVAMYDLPSTSTVATTNWVEGVYQLTASYGGDGNCDLAQDTVTLTIAGAGAAATGGGFFTVPGAGRVNFGFTVRVIAKTKPTQYKGQIVIVNKGKWKLKGDVTAYVKSGTSGAIGGSGTLWWWDASLDSGLGDWVVAATTVEYTLSMTSATKTAPATVGVRINHQPTGSEPTALPNSAPQPLKGGMIRLS